ncbi:MAG: CheY-like chemotaxis protein [Verrucomicrobiales bacterium]|jgi:CheY-like chemotaxis protein
MQYHQSDPKWETFRQNLIAATDDTSRAWLDEGEIRTLLHDACQNGISIDLILACQNACVTEDAFADRLAGVVGSRKRRILAVDDEQDYLALLQMNFGRSNEYEFLTESDSRRAVGVVEEFQPDLCIIDLKMPNLDGAQLIGKIREKSNFRSIPVIVVTALLEGTNVEAVTMDHVLHLPKPTSWRKLSYCVKAHLELDNDNPASGLATIDV